MIERILSPRPITDTEKNGHRSLIIPQGNYVVSLPHPNPSEVNNAIIYHVHLGESTDAVLRAKLQLLQQILSEPAFDQLRTKEQLGYIVQTSMSSRVGAIGWKVLIQSERDPVYLETRVDSFLAQAKGILEGLTEEEFGRHRDSLIAKREEKPKNLREESERFWARISDRYYEFGKRKFACDPVSFQMAHTSQVRLRSNNFARLHNPMSLRFLQTLSLLPRRTGRSCRLISSLPTLVSNSTCPRPSL
jgi:insulysin